MPESLLSVHQYAYTEEYEQQRGKGSFPAHLTPGYKMSKKATEQASDVSRQSKNVHIKTLLQTPDHRLIMVFVSHQIKYRQMYEQEMKGKASTEAAVAEAVHARENAENFSQVRNLLLLLLLSLNLKASCRTTWDASYICCLKFFICVSMVYTLACMI